MTITQEFLDIPTTCVSDALNGLTNMNSEIRPLKENYRIAGRAFTVQMPVGDNLVVLKAIRNAKPGDILVIDAKGDTYRAIAGDFILGMAQELGIQAVVVDGVIRDVTGIKDLNFPVFGKGTTIAASGKAGVGEINIPISCGGVTVLPGDIIVGDADGITVVPQDVEEVTLEKAKAKKDTDETRASNILGYKDKIIAYLDDLINK